MDNIRIFPFRGQASYIVICYITLINGTIIFIDIISCRHRNYVKDSIPANRGFVRQPCSIAGTIDYFSYGKKCSFLCKIFSLFLHAMQNGGRAKSL